MNLLVITKQLNTRKRCLVSVRQPHIEKNMFKQPIDLLMFSSTRKHRCGSHNCRAWIKCVLYQRPSYYTNMYHVWTVLGTDALSVYLFIFVLVKDRGDKFSRIGFLIILRYFFYLYQLDWGTHPSVVDKSIFCFLGKKIENKNEKFHRINPLMQWNDLFMTR